MRVTLGIQKSLLNPSKGGATQYSSTTLRQNIDLYNDTSIEKLNRKVAERLEIGTTIVRRDLDQLIPALRSVTILQ